MILCIITLLLRIIVEQGGARMRYIIIIFTTLTGLALLINQRMRILNMLLSIGLLRKWIVHFTFSQPRIRSRVMASLIPNEN